MLNSNKNNRKKVVLLVCMLLISFSLIIAYHNFTDDGENKSEIKRHHRSAQRSFPSFENISIKTNFENETTLDLKAEKAFVRNRKFNLLRLAFQKVVEMESVLFTHNENNDNLITVKSDYAILYMGSNKILFKGNVLYSSGKGKTIQAEKFLWDNKKKIIKQI